MDDTLKIFSFEIRDTQNSTQYYTIVANSRTDAYNKVEQCLDLQGVEPLYAKSIKQDIIFTGENDIKEGLVLVKNCPHAVYHIKLT